MTVQLSKDEQIPKIKESNRRPTTDAYASYLSEPDAESDVEQPLLLLLPSWLHVAESR